MRFVALGARIPPRIAFWTLAGLLLFISHDAIFLAQIGPGEALTRALREGGHDYWSLASLILAAIGVGTCITSWLWIRRLRRRASELDVTLGVARSRQFMGTWWRLFAVVAVGFLVQENLEHAAAHAHVLGLGALIGPQYPLALPVLALTSGMAALVASTFRAAEHQLLEVIAAAMIPITPRAPRALPRPARLVTTASAPPIARSAASRAPPGRLATST